MNSMHLIQKAPARIVSFAGILYKKSMDVFSIAVVAAVLSHMWTQTGTTSTLRFAAMRG